ncbi:uncharacterized protein [Salvelinus alpinus]|uniref:uncharacterized protein n=1 Tax=Salvelinus alpinus TaxID=8036 RepID=UPI0039FC3E15
MVPMKMMTGTGLYSLACLLMISSVCSTCVPLECLRCDIIASPEVSGNHKADEAICEHLCSNTTQCLNTTDVENCIKDFEVFLNTSYGFEVEEGDDLTMECAHDLPVRVHDLLVFVWLKDGLPLEGENNSTVTLERIGIDTPTEGKYTCIIQSPCGNFTSDPEELEFKDLTVVIIVICGVSAVVLVLALGMGIKIMLKKDFAKTKTRMQQNTQNLRNTANTTE